MAGNPPTHSDAYAVEEDEHAELVLFQVPECYVYKIPPRKSAASYRADEWDINKWAWEGAMRVVSKGEDCKILLEDNKTGELFAQAPVKENQPLPVEAVIDSSRFFVLRIEDSSDGVVRHAFVGIGFRERPQAYDFQAALHDHLKYLNKKKEAEEMEQEYQSRPSADYSLKAGETLHLDIKKHFRSNMGGGSFFRLGNSEELRVPPSPSTPGGMGRSLSGGDKPDPMYSQMPPVPILAPPPAPRGSPSPLKSSQPCTAPSSNSMDIDEDFGDFQAA